MESQNDVLQNVNYNDFTGQSPDDSTEEHIFATFAIDKSSSVHSHEAVINSSSNKMIDSLRTLTNGKPCNLSILTFNSSVDVLIKHQDIKEIQSIPYISCSGCTALIEAGLKAIELTEERKLYYKNSHYVYKCPVIILLTDGAPSYNEKKDELILKIKDGVNRRSFIFQAIGIGSADMNFLQEISHPMYPPILFSQADYTKVFDFVSNSIATAGATLQKTVV